MTIDNETKVAAGYLLDHAHLFEAVITLAKGVRSVEELEQSANEAEHRKQAAQADLESVGTEIAALQERIASAGDDLEKARSEAKSIVDAARAEAADIVKAAEADADAIERAGRENAEGEQAKAIGAAKAAAKELEAVQQSILDAAEAERDRVMAETAEIQARADKAKAYLDELAGR